MTPKEKTLDIVEEGADSNYLPSGWNKTTVEELVERGALEKPMDGNHGSDHPTSEDYVNEGIPFVLAKNLKQGKLDAAGCKKLPKEFTENLRKGFAREGDVLLSHKGTVGRTAVLDELDTEYIMLSPQVTYYRVTDDSVVNNDYLKYYFDTFGFQKILESWAGGSTRPYLGITAQRELPIILPPIQEQKAIAEMLKPFDEKIKSNEKTTATLENISQALFSNWLLNFDSFDGELEYDDDFDREVPVGWEKKPLDEIAEFLNGKAWQQYSEEECDDTLPVIKVKELRNGISDESDEVSQSQAPDDYIVRDGMVLFSWSASLVLTLWTEGEAFLNQHLFKVTSEEHPRWFYYEWINHHINRFRNIAEAKKTTMGHIKRSDLKEAKVLVPDEESFAEMSEIMELLFTLMVKNQAENRNLDATRETLLPKLMSGEIRVNDINLDDLEVSSEV